MVGGRAPSASRRLLSYKGVLVVAVAVLIFIGIAVSRTSSSSRATGVLLSSYDRDSGRVLRADGYDTAEEQQHSLSTLSEAGSGASSGQLHESDAALEGPPHLPRLAAQDGMVAEALAKVQQAADTDQRLQQWSDNPAQERARAAALEKMMGINRDKSAAEGTPHDASLERARRAKDVVEAVRGCSSLECLRASHGRPQGRAKFHFPHFLLIGWQKTATTSLFAYLNRHPEINRPMDKEPEFFSNTCGYQVPSGCPVNETADYIRRVLRSFRYTGYQGCRASYEASTHYSRNGHLMAHDLAAVMPWVKVVASLRDPISRAASMLVHQLDKNVTVDSADGPLLGGCLAQSRGDLGHCLLTWSHISGDDWGGPTNYSYPLRHWLEAFPTDQVFLVQYENLTSADNEAAMLHELKAFLGVDTAQPKGYTLGMSNSRKHLINPDGWRMTRLQYQKIVDLVRPDCQAVAALVDRYGLGDGRQWMANWEAGWAKNMATCDAKGWCQIQLT